MVGAPPSLHPCPPRASPTCPILYNIAPQVVLCPEIAPSASCTTHAPCLRLRAAHPRLALLGLSAGTGGRRLWRHPADRGLRAHGMLAALRRGSCGGICGLDRALRSSWARLASSQPTLAAANALPLCPHPVSWTPQLSCSSLSPLPRDAASFPASWPPWFSRVFAKGEGSSSLRHRQ
jgi:hypothetical protein